MEQRILDEKTRKALRGFLPFSCDSFVDFTPEQITTRTPPIPMEFQPKFSIRSMTKSEKTEYDAIRSNIKADEKGVVPSSEYKAAGEKSMKIFQQCLKSWRDFYDLGTGRQIVFPATKEEAWSILPDWIQIEVSSEIRKISNLLPVEMLSLK